MDTADEPVGDWSGDRGVYPVVVDDVEIGEVFQVMEPPEECWLAHVGPWWDDYPTREAAEAGARDYWERTQAVGS